MNRDITAIKCNGCNGHGRIAAVERMPLFTIDQPEPKAFVEVPMSSTCPTCDGHGRLYWSPKGKDYISARALKGEGYECPKCGGPAVMVGLLSVNPHLTCSKCGHGFS